MIYLDFNATTPMLPEAAQAMQPYLTDVYGNPSSAHGAGRKARQALENARERIAHLLGADPDEVIFTSGATEANNLAILGLAGAPPGVILSSLVEHPCVVEPVRELAARGFEVQSREPLFPAAGSVPQLCCRMLVNHETGAIFPVRELVAQLPPTTLVHCDAAQAVGKIPVNFHELGVASLTASGHKFHGPKGIGLLLLKRSCKLQPMLRGGHQQQGRRPGTESVALAVGLCKALEIAHEKMTESFAHVRGLRQRLLDHLSRAARPIVVNENLTPSPFPMKEGGLIVNAPGNSLVSPYVLNVSFPGCRADVLLMKLDLAGVACSTGSACSSGSLLPSPVLRALGVAEEAILSALRFSFAPQLTIDDVDRASHHIVKAVKELRATG